MRLKSALEDFEANTLGALPGPLGRLSYVGQLHDGNGAYDHWGLAQIYGAEAAQRALRASHRGALSDVLRKPLATLLQDLIASCSSQELTERDFLSGVANTAPKPLSSAARAHLASVVSALSALAENQNTPNFQPASRPQ